METNGLLIQDLTDILEINRQRVTGFNAGAYGCENLPLKMLLNRDLDNSRDSVLALKRLLFDRFEITSGLAPTGQLFRIWFDFKPSFDEVGMELLLPSVESADLLTLQCYRLLITRTYMDIISKNLLEFQYQNQLTIYTSLKGFRQTHMHCHSNAEVYHAKKSG